MCLEKFALSTHCSLIFTYDVGELSPLKKVSNFLSEKDYYDLRLKFKIINKVK
jgi:hypothetical protein